MKGASPLAAGMLLLAGALGMFRLSGQAAAPAARDLSRTLVSQTLGELPREEDSAPKRRTETSAGSEAAAVPVERVEEAWDERQRQTAHSEPPASAPVRPETSLELRNDTDYDIDFSALPALPPGLKLKTEDPVVLIVHTHTTESYTIPGQSQEEAVYRSRAEDDGVMAVGDAMAAVLEDRGYRVIHDKTLCDYPEYNGAYNRSRQVIESDLAAYPSVCLVIDLHRDALTSADGSQLRLAADLEGREAAQVMLVVGTDDGGLEHPNWARNLSLAAVIQTAVEAKHPGLMRPINLRSERFNQDLGPMGLLLEVGTSGNTLEEAILGGTCAAEGIADVFDRCCGDNS